MESSNIIILYSEPILDQYQNIYLNILTLSGIPKGPLLNMTKRIKVPNLSPFQTFSSSSNNPFPNCIYALQQYPNQWMYEDDLPYIFSYLQNHNYKIETIHNININHSQKNRKQICIFSYNHPI
jgi:hypothetical protein